MVMTCRFCKSIQRNKTTNEQQSLFLQSILPASSVVVISLPSKPSSISIVRAIRSVSSTTSSVTSPHVRSSVRSTTSVSSVASSTVSIPVSGPSPVSSGTTSRCSTVGPLSRILILLVVVLQVGASTRAFLKIYQHAIDEFVVVFAQKFVGIIPGFDKKIGKFSTRRSVGSCHFNRFFLESLKTSELMQVKEICR